MQRIGLLSQNKPHEVTHRRHKSIVITTESDVCLENGLRYQYHDNGTDSFVDDFRITDEIPKLSTYKLPSQSSSLQQFLFRPAAMPSGPSPNNVIASQSDCPDHMSLDEYKALSTIPLGYLIQWQNILLQLSLPSVDFKKVETGLVILQSIYQAGPSSNGNILRAGHEILDDENFAHVLLGSLQEASQRVKENWESSQALSTFISLATRLLSLTSAEQIQDRCLVYLASVRAVALGWVNRGQQRSSLLPCHAIATQSTITPQSCNHLRLIDLKALFFSPPRFQLELRLHASHCLDFPSQSPLLPSDLYLLLQGILPSIRGQWIDQAIALSIVPLGRSVFMSVSLSYYLNSLLELLLQPAAFAVARPLSSSCFQMGSFSSRSLASFITLAISSLPSYPSASLHHLSTTSTSVACLPYTS